MKAKIISIINDTCSKYEVDPKCIKALCLLESNMNPWLVKYDPDFIWTFKPEYFAKMNKISNNTELTLQKTSFGLMQIMGGTARTPLAFTGMLTMLLNPKINIELGVGYFKSLLVRYGGNYQDAVCAYDSGAVKKIKGKYVNSFYMGKYNSIISTLDYSD